MNSVETKLDKNSKTSDIDQLCELIDQSTFGFVPVSKTSRSSPSCQVKTFRCSRLKRLNSSKLTRSSRNEHEEEKTPISTSIDRRISFCSSFLNRFRRLSTRSRQTSKSTLTLYRTESNLSSIIEEEKKPLSTYSIVEQRRATGNCCNVEELAAYLDNYLYLPKSLSGAAELMYT